MELRSSADVLAVHRASVSPYTSYDVSPVFGDPRQRNDGPQVFLVRQVALGVTPPHFHCVPQFQVFVDGDGTIGKHHLAPTALHYVDPWTPYGPIVSGEAGISYFTARMDFDLGAHYMPGAREERKPHKSGRAFTVALDSSAHAGTMASVISPHEDGLASYVTGLGHGEPLRLDLIPAHDRRLLFVISGSLVSLDGRTWPAWSWACAPGTAPDFGQPELRAGADGARVAVLDYPRFAPEA